MTANNPSIATFETEKRAVMPVIRVMLVDDSAVIRGMLTRIIETEPDLQVISSASDGVMALTVLRTRPVDVLVLDLEMPNMDGLTALPKLKATQPSVKIIIVSSLTRENAEIAMKAMRLGAEDYLSKPNTTSEMTSITAFRRDVINKIRALGGKSLEIDQLTTEIDTESAPQKTNLVKSTLLSPKPLAANEKLTTTPATLRATPPAASATPDTLNRSSSTKKNGEPIKLLPMPSFFESAAIAIGSSTGGPQALFTLLADWPTKLQQPIFITQHMPPTFTTILAEHISRISKRQAAEAQEGEILKPGRIYIAPGDFHLSIEEVGKDKILRVRQTPPENFCRPSVDPMFSSLSKVYQKNLLAIMLTGMGRDGLAGTQAIIDKGGLAIAQDEASSVVWGMPGTIANAGLCSAVLALPEMAAFLSKLLLRGES